MKTRKIVTEFVCPPIPDRRFDWQACREGWDEGEPMGSGRTEREAIIDLLNEEEDEKTETSEPPEKVNTSYMPLDAGPNWDKVIQVFLIALILLFFMVLIGLALILPPK